MDYDYNQEKKFAESSKGSSGLGIASMVCGILSLTCFNPLYLVASAAVILGIISLCQKNTTKGFGIAGIICGALAILFGIILDIILLPITFGASFLF